jgi:hypothetical protein
MYKDKYEWERDLKQRFDTLQKDNPNGFLLSIKIGVETGCFHNEHSPHAYDEIYNLFENNRYECEFIEHESGPEIIAWVALGTAGLVFAKSIVDLVTAIINARAIGRKKGDKPDANLRLIVREYVNKSNINEEKILVISDGSLVSEEDIRKVITNEINDAFRKQDK